MSSKTARETVNTFVLEDDTVTKTNILWSFKTEKEIHTEKTNLELKVFVTKMLRLGSVRYPLFTYATSTFS